jgi:hypothetical protein
MAIDARVVDLRASIEHGFAVLRLRRLDGALADLDERLSQLHPLTIVLRAAAHHQQVAPFGEHVGTVANGFPLVVGLRREFLDALRVHHTSNRVPVLVRRRLDDRGHELLYVRNRPEWRRRWRRRGGRRAIARRPEYYAK